VAERISFAKGVMTRAGSSRLVSGVRNALLVVGALGVLAGALVVQSLVISARPSDDANLERASAAFRHLESDRAADLRRCVIVDVLDGFARGPLRVHLYDLGPRTGFRLVGIERPEGDDPPP
jgi:hypothetical protein